MESIVLLFERVSFKISLFFSGHDMKKNTSKKNSTVAVIGIGRVGLPLALILAEKGFTVYGIGRNEKKTEQVNEGIMPFMEKGAPSILRRVKGKTFFATVDYSHVVKCDFIILTLGTPIDENMNPVFSQIHDAVASMKQFLRPGQTLILRSTVTPGTTKYVRSMLEADKSLKVGINFFLAFCPERIAEGKAIEEIETVPQMIGGVDAKSGKKAEELFKKIGVATMLTDDVSAELAKLFTNMYRYINFAMANEFMILADNYHKDIHEIVDLVNFGYTRGGVSLPGLTAGPCLFKDGFFMISDLPFADLFLTSWKINESIPHFLVKKLRDTMVLANKKVTILGLAFKAEIDDVRASLSFKARKALLRERMEVALHDPYLKNHSEHRIEKDIYQALDGANVIFVGTNHKEYKHLDMKRVRKIVKKNCIVCDVWNVFGTGKIIFSLSDYF